MQKVEGSSPFIRFDESPAQAGFFRSGDFSVRVRLGTKTISTATDCHNPTFYKGAELGRLAWTAAH